MEVSDGGAWRIQITSRVSANKTSLPTKKTENAASLKPLLEPALIWRRSGSQRLTTEARIVFSLSVLLNAVHLNGNKHFQHHLLVRFGVGAESVE